MNFEQTIAGRNGNKLCGFSLDNPKFIFEFVNDSVMVQCAGYRRNEVNQAKKVNGGVWKLETTRNVVWTETLLSDVIARAAGNDVNKVTNGDLVRQTCFERSRQDPVTGTPYEAGVPTDVICRHLDAVSVYGMIAPVLSWEPKFSAKLAVQRVNGAHDMEWVNHTILSDRESP